MPPKNYRDVGEWVNCIAEDRLLPEKRILRSGKIDFVESVQEIGEPGSIVNLRMCKDPIRFPQVDTYHFPISNNLEKYETNRPEVRKWILSSVGLLMDDSLKYPVLYHCASGRDRTGVVIAALLLVLDVPRNIIIEEYLLSEGKNVREERICQALEGMTGDSKKYFKGLDPDKIRKNVNPGCCSR